MVGLVHFTLATLLSCGIQGASLPVQNGYEFHFNQMGVRLDLAMKDLNPLVGGKAHVELPTSAVYNLVQKDASFLRPIINVLEKTTLPIWKLLEVEAPFLKPIIGNIEENILDRITDVMTVKADMTFNAEKVLEGIFNVAVDFTIVHQDGTEEKATLLIQGKGKVITSMEIIPKTNVVNLKKIKKVKKIKKIKKMNKKIKEMKKIFFPLKMTFTSNWPSAHTLTIGGDFGKILLNIANDMNEVSVKGVVEYLGQQYKYSTVLSIKERSFTATVEEPSKELHDIAIKFKMLNGFPMIEITGNTPACHLFTYGQTQVIMNNWYDYEIKHIFHGDGVFNLKLHLVNGFPRIDIAGNVPPKCHLFPTGVFKTEVIMTSLFHYEIKHLFNGMEMLNLNLAINNGKIEMIVKYGQAHKTHIVMEYEYLRWIKIVFPTTNSWLTKDLGIEMHYQPTNEERHLEGGNIKIVAKHDNSPIMNIGGYYGLTLDSTKYEVLLKNVYINMLNKEITVIGGITFSELKYSGKIFYDRMSKNTLLPRFSMEAKIHKDEKMVFHYLLTTVETPYKLRIFFPYLFHDIMNMKAKELEVTHEHVALGNKQVITTQCNLTNKKLIATVTPTTTSFELFDSEVSLIKYVTELTKIDIGTNSLLLEGSKIVQLNAYHPCILPEALCFNKLVTKFHLEVADKAAGKVKINVAVTKDTTEVVNVVINNVEAPYQLVLEAPVVPLEMRIDYELSTKVWNVMINNRSYLMVKPTVANEVEVFINGALLCKVALLGKELKITTIMKNMPEITTTVSWKTFSLFQNTLGIEILEGKVSHKTLLSWNINMLRKGFVDIKFIGSGTELFGDYEIVGHKNWNIIDLKNIDVEWTGKVFCAGIKLFKTPMLTEGTLLFKNFVLDLKMVENLMNVPYTLIFKTKPLTVAFLPFFQYP